MHVFIHFMSSAMAASIELSLMRCAVSASRCVFNDCAEKQGLVCVPKSKRYEILRIHKIYIPKRCVICQDHLREGNWNNFVSLEFKYTKEYIEDMIDLLSKPLQKQMQLEIPLANHKDAKKSD